MKITIKDFENAGYSKTRALQLASNSNFNWKASDGGKRKMPVSKSSTTFTNPSSAQINKGI